MARFTYRMQNILNIKSKLEEQVKNHYALTLSVLYEENEKMEQLKRRQQYYEEETKGKLNDVLNIREIMDGQEAIKKMKEAIKEQILHIRAAEKNVEMARVKLQEIMQERKTHEKLREKAFEEFMHEELARESKEIDELTSYTYGKKIEG